MILSNPMAIHSISQYLYTGYFVRCVESFQIVCRLLWHPIIMYVLSTYQVKWCHGRNDQNMKTYAARNSNIGPYW